MNELKTEHGSGFDGGGQHGLGRSGGGKLKFSGFANDERGNASSLACHRRSFEFGGLLSSVNRAVPRTDHSEASSVRQSSENRCPSGHRSLAWLRFARAGGGGHEGQQRV